MAQRLKTILSVTNLAAGASVALPHNLHTSVGRPLAPDIIFLPTPDLEVVASTTTTVTVKNNSTAPITDDILIEAWHTFERAFNNVNNENLPVKPYIVVSVDGELNALATRIVFRPGDPQGSHDNVYVTWAETYAALQSVRERGAVYLEFDDRFSSPCTIPAGVWNMSSVIWTNCIEGPSSQPSTLVELADGASIIVDAPITTMLIQGYGLQIRCNRTGPVAPFVGVNLILDGTQVRLFNTDPSALPMFVAAAPTQFIHMTGTCTRGQIGSSTQQPVPAPLLDVAGNGIVVLGGAGLLFNDVFTDSVGGGFASVRTFDDNFNGGGGEFTTFQFPTLIANGGVFIPPLTEHRDRHVVDAIAASAPDATPWLGFLNELVRVDSSTGAVTVLFPPSTNNPGERFVVKDIGGDTDSNPITLTPFGAETIESASIGDFQAKVWVADGQGTWMFIATNQL